MNYVNINFHLRQVFIFILLSKIIFKSLSHYCLVYDPNMPKTLPIKDIITGLFINIFKAIKFWLHSTLVAVSWLGIVPLTASRIYKCLFTGSVSSLLTLPLDMLSTDNIIRFFFSLFLLFYLLFF